MNPSRSLPRARGTERPRSHGTERGKRHPVARPLFEHVLVPIDLSDRNERALRIARDLAARSHARVTLLHVVQHVADIPLAEVRSFYDPLVESSLRRLAAAAAPFAAAGIPVRTEVCIGRPASEIVRMVSARGADLVLMGSHKVGRGGDRRGWGTTSYAVGIFCQCPILLVK